MPQNIKLWKVINNKNLKEIPQDRIQLEEKLEDYVEDDISMISDDLLLIGRQVTTDLGGAIDLLCLDSNGDIVILELKRDKTPREVVSQILDYAAWADKLSHDEISKIAQEYFEDETTLEEAFEEKFGTEIPEVINESHKGIIVAAKVDERTERIIQYLSDSYGVGINVTTFQFFKENGRKYLSRVFLIEPSEAERRTQRRGGSKRKPDLTHEELEELAEENGVLEMYKPLVNDLQNKIEYDRTTRSGIAFVGINRNGRRVTIMSLVPDKSSAEQGLYYKVYIDRFADYFGLKETIDLFPGYEKRKSHEREWIGEEGEGYFESKHQVEIFLSKLNKES